MKIESTTKLLTVAPNGQISIGKQWAGRQIAIEQVSESEIRIVSGTFVPDDQATFYSSEAKEKLEAFDHWSGKNLPKESDLNSLRTKLGKKTR